MPALVYTSSNFPFQPFTKIYSADVDTCFTDIRTLLNTTKLDSTNVQAHGLVRYGATSNLVAGTANFVVYNDSNGDLTEAATLPVAKGGTGAATANAGFNALSPMTTGGDLIYGGASGAATRLANGTAGQTLQSAGTTSAPTWSSAIACRASGTPSSTTVGNVIILGTADFDTNSAYNTGTGRYTVPYAGKYLVAVYINTTNSVTINVYKNASSDAIITQTAGGIGYGATVVSCAAGDILDIRPGGTTGNFGAGSTASYVLLR